VSVILKKFLGFGSFVVSVFCFFSVKNSQAKKEEG